MKGQMSQLSSVVEGSCFSLQTIPDLMNAQIARLGSVIEAECNGLHEAMRIKQEAVADAKATSESLRTELSCVKTFNQQLEQQLQGTAAAAWAQSTRHNRHGTT